MTTPVSAPEYTKLPVGSLLFDADNPRFGDLPGSAGAKQEAIQQVLMREPHFAGELIDSLVKNGFIAYEPLIVRKKGSKWVVVEGNRRLAAIQQIRGDCKNYGQIECDRLAEIPVLSFPAMKSQKIEDDLRVYLGVRHLFGYREWPPLSKAKFLDDEIKRFSVGQIADEIGISKQEIRRFVVPYRILAASRLGQAIEDDFWVFAEALSRTGIQRFIELDVDASNLSIKSFSKARLLELLDDLYGKKKKGGAVRDLDTKVIGETRDLKVLASVLTHSGATAALRKGKTLEEAADYIDTKPQKLRKLVSLAERLASTASQIAAGNKTAEAAELKAQTATVVRLAKRFAAKNG